MPHFLDPGGESDNKALKLGTRRRAHVKNEMRLESPKQQLEEDLRKIQAIHPNARLRSVTATYNCVGMVFASRRTWVDTDDVYTFLKDDRYRQIPTLDQADLGDVVVYRKDGGIEHVGIIAERHENLKDGTVSFKIMSKWGPMPEFVHDPEDVLISFGELAEVWSDRKSL